MPPKRAKKKAPVAAPDPVPALPPPPAPLTLPRPEGFGKAAAWVGAFFLPAFGLVLAFLYWSAPDRSASRFAKVALLVALAGWLLSLGGDAVNSGLQSGEWFIQPY